MALLMLLPACSGGGGDDGGMHPTLDARTEYGSFIKVNLKDPSAVLKMPPMTLPVDAPINTDSSPLCSTNHDQQADKYCVIVGSTVTVAKGTTFRAYGTRPLVLLATTMFDLEGTIDVSSNHDGTATQAGAGALPASTCPNTTAATGNSGGFGGSFMGKGGDGTAVDGVKGAAASVSPQPMDLRGGCPGGDGSSTTVGVIPTGGRGGGAVAISAHDKIIVNGKINASGAGGQGGPAQKSGGAGGGSGGMIVLDVAQAGLMVGTGPDIWLFANGGGGGQGGTGTGINIGAGDSGQESPDPMTRAPGGSNQNRDGGQGGAGSAGTLRLDGGQALNANNAGGGGGGGGGAGFIYTPNAPGAIVAPPATYP